jgi:hypothetical protein
MRYWQIWFAEFFRCLWRRNDYYWPGQRCGVRNAAFVAGVIARTCAGR